MSGLENLSNQELLRLAEQSKSSYELEALNPLMAREMAYRGLLLSNGVYDATLDEYDVTERIESRWAVELDDNPNILKSTD